MFFVYLSDESVAKLREEEPLDHVGAHIGEWLPVLQEVAQWRTGRVTAPNKLALPVVVAYAREISSFIKYMKPNTKATPEIVAVLRALRNEVANVVTVEVPSYDELGRIIERTVPDDVLTVTASIEEEE